MKALRKLFFDTKMTWPRVIIFSLITTVITVMALVIPFIAHTSAVQIGVTFECWIFFALIIIMNCEKPLEAGLKTFVFFIISQPLIYLLQIPFGGTFDNFLMNYPRWFIWTVLTFPGAMLAWFVKKDNIWSALILSVATGFLSYEVIYYLKGFLDYFPHNTIALIVTLLIIVVLILTLLQNTTTRLICTGITMIVAIVSLIFIFFVASKSMQIYQIESNVPNQWEIVSVEGDDIGDISLNSDKDSFVVNADTYGSCDVTVKGQDEDTQVYTIEYNNKDGIQFYRHSPQ